MTLLSEHFHLDTLLYAPYLRIFHVYFYIKFSCCFLQLFHVSKVIVTSDIYNLVPECLFWAYEFLIPENFLTVPVRNSSAWLYRGEQQLRGSGLNEINPSRTRSKGLCVTRCFHFLSCRMFLSVSKTPVLCKCTQTPGLLSSRMSLV